MLKRLLAWLWPPDPPADCRACPAKAYVIAHLEAERNKDQDKAREREAQLLERNADLMNIVRAQTKQLAELSGVRASLGAVMPTAPRPKNEALVVAAGMQGMIGTHVEVPPAQRLRDMRFVKTAEQEELLRRATEAGSSAPATTLNVGSDVNRP